jgi:hypothetical protein
MCRTICEISADQQHHLHPGLRNDIHHAATTVYQSRLAGLQRWQAERAAGIAGDWEAARHVELELPETGVCSDPIGQTEPSDTAHLDSVGRSVR